MLSKCCKCSTQLNIPQLNYLSTQCHIIPAEHVTSSVLVCPMFVSQYPQLHAGVHPNSQSIKCVTLSEDSKFRAQNLRYSFNLQGTFIKLLLDPRGQVQLLKKPGVVECIKQHFEEICQYIVHPKYLDT